MKNRRGSPNSLIYAGCRLKEIQRRGWMRKVGVKNAESVADHSFRMALLGVLISTEEGLDSAKVTRMCLIHDLGESVIGDLMPEEKQSEASHRQLEEEAVTRILLTLPKRSQKLLLSDWKELNARLSREATLAWQIDKLEMSLQAKEYVMQGYSYRKLREFDSSRKLSGDLRRILRAYRPHVT